jgi:hypothetical protein
MALAYYFEVKSVEDKELAANIALYYNEILWDVSFDFVAIHDDGDKECVYLFLEGEKPLLLKKRMQETEILLRFEEVSDELLSANLNSPSWENWEEESQLKILRFIRQHLTLDHVLDKINVWGFETLTPIDMEVLDRAI